jgi:L-fuculose-phosphate aldolase
MNMLTGGKATSEIRLHLEIYRQREDIRAVVHSHPPHATAFAVANRPFPCATLAEPDLFLGEVALAPFQVPGTMEFAESVAPFVQDTNAVILSNHGVVTYAEDLETAFWMTEILESACKTVILSMSIGGPQQLSKEQGRELARARKNYGFNDARDLMASDCDVRGHSLFHQHLGLQEVDLDFFSKHRKRMDSGSTD